MSRWLIEKSGTGIEKSGTGIEKSGTGIEKSGTGIEKSGTGIEKSGTGLRSAILACALSGFAFASTLNAADATPNGVLTLHAENGVLLASWSFDGSIFSGVANIYDSTASLSLTEISLADDSSFNVVGGGTGADVVGGGTGTDVVGGGTGTKTKVVGGGTGADVVGGGTGTQVVGGGTGVEVVGGGTGVQVVGGGTGTDVVGGGTGAEVVGGGTGANVVGGGTGSRTLVVGGGTGEDAIAISLPGEDALRMDVTLGCNTATVYVLDSKGFEVISFEGVKVHGTTGLCNSYLEPTDIYDVWDLYRDR